MIILNKIVKTILRIKNPVIGPKPMPKSLCTSRD